MGVLKFQNLMTKLSMANWFMIIKESTLSCFFELTFYKESDQIGFSGLLDDYCVLCNTG